MLPPPGLCLMLSTEPTLDWTFQSNFWCAILLSPPPGRCLALSREPTLEPVFQSSFWVSIWNHLRLKICLKWHWQLHAYPFVASLWNISFVKGLCSGLNFPIQFLIFDFEFATPWLVVGIGQAAHFRLDFFQIRWRGGTNLNFVHGHCKIENIQYSRPDFRYKVARVREEKFRL